jgi:hypothetical protein
LNANKSKALTISLGRRTQEKKEIVLRGEPIPATEELKLLGVILDPSLSYARHWQAVVKECRRQVGALWRNLGGDKNAFTLAYHSIVEGKIGNSLPVCPPTRASEWNLLLGVPVLAARYLQNDYESDRFTILKKSGILAPGELYLKLVLPFLASYFGDGKDETVARLFQPNKGGLSRRCSLVGNSPWACRGEPSKLEQVRRLGHALSARIWNSIPLKLVMDPFPANTASALRSKETMQALAPKIASKLSTDTRKLLGLPQHIPSSPQQSP